VILPDAAAALLAPVAFASADAAAALAADDIAGYKKQLPALRTALAAWFGGYAHAAHGPLANYRNGLAEPKDLEAARTEFEPFSTAVADLARAGRLHETEKLRIFECPMSPVLGKGRWLQRAAGTRNPFYGSGMPRCGDEIAAPAPADKPAVGAPHGHGKHN
jgi:Cu(I)/Ag(I) efflux system membrane fusion protein